MKLASLKSGRDGRLVVVSRDLTRATDATHIAPTLQAALDRWELFAAALQDLAEGLEHGSVPSFRFHEHDCAAPLPRAFQKLLNIHPGDPRLCQVGSDAMIGPREALRGDALEGEAGIAVILGDVPMGADRKQGLAAIRLVMLAHETTLSALVPAERASGDGLLRSKPPGACSPVAVTPDELGEAWKDGAVHLPLHSTLNGKSEAGEGARSDFGALITHAAATRPLGAGTIIVAAGVMPGRPLAAGDQARIEAKDRKGHSIFGAIENRVEPANPPQKKP